jgi:hypothetical protein
MRRLIRIVICRTLILDPGSVDVPLCYALLFDITLFCLIGMAVQVWTMLMVDIMREEYPACICGI